MSQAKSASLRISPRLTRVRRTTIAHVVLPRGRDADRTVSLSRPLRRAFARLHPRRRQIPRAAEDAAAPSPA